MTIDQIVYTVMGLAVIACPVIITAYAVFAEIEHRAHRARCRASHAAWRASRRGAAAGGAAQAPSATGMVTPLSKP